MATGQDTTYSGQSKIYIKQQPAGTSINGNTVTTEEVTDVGGLQSQFGLSAFNGTILPGKVNFSPAKGAANICIITITIQDNGAQPILNTPFDVDVVLSDAATGVGVTATTPSVSATITTGTTLNTYVANKAFYAQTNASGVIVLTINDAAKTGYFIMVQGAALPVPYVSAQLVAANYGP